MFLAQITNAPQLPDLPEGPTLDRVLGPIEIPSFETWQISVSILATLVLLVAVTWLIIRSKKNSKKTIPPYEIAIAGLDANSGLAKEDDEGFAVLCSQILRRYLEDDLGIKSTARTSEEFLRSLEGNISLKDKYQEELAKVLTGFDRIKFAQGKITNHERSAISDTVRDLITRAHQTKKTEGGQK